MGSAGCVAGVGFDLDGSDGDDDGLRDSVRLFVRVLAPGRIGRGDFLGVCMLFVSSFGLLNRGCGAAALLAFPVSGPVFADGCGDEGVRGCALCFRLFSSSSVFLSHAEHVYGRV